MDWLGDWICTAHVPLFMQNDGDDASDMSAGIVLLPMAILIEHRILLATATCTTLIVRLLCASFHHLPRAGSPATSAQ
jgi:hypothetical protein